MGNLMHISKDIAYKSDHLPGIHEQFDYQFFLNIDDECEFFFFTC